MTNGGILTHTGSDERRKKKFFIQKISGKFETVDFNFVIFRDFYSRLRITKKKKTKLVYYC